MAKIEVYRKDSGEKVWVPAHWMDHPRLSKPFRKTPKTRAAENTTADTETSESAGSANPTRTTTAVRKTPTTKE